MRAALFFALAAFCFATPAQALLCVPLLGCSCSVTAHDIDFGGFAPSAGEQRAEGLVEIDCTGLIELAPSIRVELSPGMWGPFAQRKLRSAGGDLLDYNIYAGEHSGVIWGDGAPGAPPVWVSGPLVVAGRWQVARPVHARAMPTPNAKPGLYEDVINVRIVW